MKHPVLMIVLLVLSIFHVTRRFLLAPSDVSPLQMQRMQRSRQQKKSTSAVVVEVSDVLHRAIPQDIDHPVVISERPHSPLLTTRLGTPGRGPADNSNNKGATTVHVPYALWAHGHLVFLHHLQHGDVDIATLIEGFESRDIPVDAVILDAHWWHPANYLLPHPQLYPNGFQWVETPSPSTESDTSATTRKKNGVSSGDIAHRLSFGSSGHRIVLWMSALVPTSTAQYREGRKKQYFVHGGSGDDPHLFAWPRKDGPSLHGVLIDFTNPMAVQWFGAMLVELLHQNPAVSGFRCAGVDALLVGMKELFGAAGHINDRLYRNLYYRFFLDIGRSVRGISFLIVGRAVDSFGPYHYQQFAPRESLFAGWVGDHPFTFSGMRESAMNVVHSAYECYTSVGSMIGGSFVDVPQTREAFETWRAGMDLADVGTTLAHRTYHELGRHYMEGEAFPPTLAATACDEKDLMRMRNKELFERWLQWSATMPFLSNGGGTTGSPWAYSDGTTRQYARLVHAHRALALYYATAAAASFDHFFDSEFHYQNVPFRNTKLRADPRADHCPLVPLSADIISFSAPNSPLRWAMRVGPDLVVVPVFDSFGDSLNDTVTLSAMDIDLKQLHGVRLSDWILLGRPATTALTRSGLAVPISIPPPEDVPLLLRRRDSIIPILQAIGVSSSVDAATRNDAAGVSSVSVEGDDDEDERGPMQRRCLSTGVIMTVDRPPLDVQLTVSTPTAVVDPNHVVPAMDVSMTVFTTPVDVGGKLLDYSVVFVEDDSGAATTMNYFGVANSTDDGNNDEDGDAEHGTMWDPSLRIVTVLSVFEGGPGSLNHAHHSTMRCDCNMVDLDGSEQSVGCVGGDALQRGELLGSGSESFGSLLHERHFANTTIVHLTPDDVHGEDTVRGKCFYQSAQPASVWQLIVLSPIQGKFDCQCFLR